MMIGKRKMPEFRKRDGKWTHYFIGVIIILFSVMFFLSMFSERKTFLDWICLPGAPIMGVGMIILAIVVFGAGASVHKEKRSWFNDAVKAQATILKREIVDTDPQYASYYGHPVRYWDLQLEAIPNQLKVQPKTTSVLVSVSEYQYEKYEGRTAVTIYYSPKDPFVFLLEDEV
jgi:hypothetical protein